MCRVIIQALTRDIHACVRPMLRSCERGWRQHGPRRRRRARRSLRGSWSWRRRSRTRALPRRLLCMRLPAWRIWDARSRRCSARLTSSCGCRYAAVLAGCIIASAGVCMSLFVCDFRYKSVTLGHRRGCSLRLHNLHSCVHASVTGCFWPPVRAAPFFCLLQALFSTERCDKFRHNCANELRFGNHLTFVSGAHTPYPDGGCSADASARIRTGRRAAGRSAC